MRAAHPDERFKYVKTYPVIGSLLFPAMVLMRRIQGYRLIHIHWPAFFIRYSIPHVQRINYWLFRISLRTLQVLGYRTVWTVHNVMNHEPISSDDLSGFRRLSVLADAKIAHSEEAVRQMEEQGLSTTGTTVLPFGSYSGLYPESASPGSFREQLRIPPDITLILFFGIIRPYKGLDELIAAFDAVSSRAVHLVIAGQVAPGHESIGDRMRAASERDDRVHLVDGFVPDDQIHSLVSSADVVCLPFRRVTSTSSAVLALSLGKAIIAPRLGMLTELPDDVGFFYDPDDESGLLDALRRATGDEVETRRRAEAALVYASLLSWDAVAESTFAIYNRLATDRVRGL